MGKYFIVLFLLSIFSSTSAFSQSEYDKLSVVRGKLTVPSYTPSQRQVLAEQSLMAIEHLFVHRELKIRDFGQSSDPVPKLSDLRDQSSSMDNDLFHDEMSSIFLGMHDLHTNYMAPAPRSCGLPFIPLKFQGATDAGIDRILVSAKLRLGGEYVEDIEKGMELVSVDGVAIETHLADLGRFSGGANTAAMRFRAIQMLSFRGASTYPLPVADEVNFVFQSTSGQKTLTVPWLALMDQSCIDGDNEVEPEVLPVSIALNMGQDEFQKQYNKFFRVHTQAPTPNLDIVINPFQERYRRLFDQPDRFDINRAETINNDLDEVFDYTVITTPAGKLGYLNIKTFYWNSNSLDVGTVTDAIRAALEGELQQANSLVIDVRGNPGGLIVFSEKLIQLFAPQGVEPTTVTMLANDLNEQIFVAANGRDNRWSQALSSAIASGNKFMTPLAITPQSEANSLGQVWFKPVVVLTDAGCYSACDLFAAGMQDNNAATIIGLHGNTGAGGANVMEYNVFRSIMGNSAANPFVELPLGQNLRLSWRQTIRAGSSAGVLIEDRGIVSDTIVPLTSIDVIRGESREMMRQIHIAIEQTNVGMKSGLSAVPGGMFFLNNGAAAAWQENVYGIDRLVIKNGQTVIEDINLSASDNTETVEISAPALSGTWDDARLTLVGYLNNKQVFRVVREFRWRGDFVKIPSAGLQYSFGADADDDVHSVSLVGPANSGWQVVNGQLRVGPGPEYTSQVLTRAFIPLQLKNKGGRVTLDLGVDAEELNDSFRIYVVNAETNERQHVYAGSQFPWREDVGFNLPMDWDMAELVFEFESDENWNFAGPVIDNIRIDQ